MNCALRSVDRAFRLDFSAALKMTRAEKSTGFSPFVISTEARSAERRNLGAQRRTKGSVLLSAVRRINCALRSVDRALRLDFSAVLEMTRAEKSTGFSPFVISTEARSAERRNLGAQRRTKGSVLLSAVRRINCALRSVDRALRLDFSAVLEMTRVCKATRAPRFDKNCWAHTSTGYTPYDFTFRNLNCL